MCGVAGFIEPAGRVTGDALKSTARAMAQTLEHRGPDDHGTWIDNAAGVALAHQRLAIVDLSPLGHQPMRSSCGRFVIAYNGEVYNFREISAELEARGRRMRGHSDTEVIVEACAEWGVQATVERLIGMFAFAVWDTVERRLTLARDRVGIKPMYWGCWGGRLIFASELKALRAHPGWHPELNRDALAAFMRHNYVPAPHTIYRGVHKLEAGCLLHFSLDSRSPEIRRYWSLDEVIVQAREQPVPDSDEAAVDRLDEVLADAVRRRMIADVPLGAFLSGGVDSSAVVALMQRESATPVRTFSIGFQEQGYNEAEHAKAVAAHLGTEHTEFYVGARDAMDVIPLLTDMYDEPFADSSQIPTYLVSRMTREHVTVSLSGDGGDELFAGYNRYLQATTSVSGNLLKFPQPLRRLGSCALQSLRPAAWDAMFSMLPASRRIPQAGDKVHKFARILREGRGSMYRTLVSHWNEPEHLVRGAHEPHTRLWDPTIENRYRDEIERMQYLDTLTYLPDDILTKVDRASMAVSLEARVPLLDHRVVAYAWSLPMRFKLRAGKTKWLLRELLYRHVPPRLIERPKVGFGIPLDAWLRGPLREWAEELLDPALLAADDILDASMVERAWREHLSGSRNWQYLIWDVLMFQAWKLRWMP